jgi:hypothetical protein
VSSYTLCLDGGRVEEREIENYLNILKFIIFYEHSSILSIPLPRSPSVVFLKHRGFKLFPPQKKKKKLFPLPTIELSKKKNLDCEY